MLGEPLVEEEDEEDDVDDDASALMDTMGIAMFFWRVENSLLSFTRSAGLASFCEDGFSIIGT